MMEFRYISLFLLQPLYMLYLAIVVLASHHSAVSRGKLTVCDFVYLSTSLALMSIG